MSESYTDTQTLVSVAAVPRPESPELATVFGCCCVLRRVHGTCVFAVSGEFVFEVLLLAERLFKLVECLNRQIDVSDGVPGSNGSLGESQHMRTRVRANVPGSAARDDLK